jgi:hypothetical protein
MRVRVEVDVWSNHVYIDLGRIAEKFYLKAKESNTDEDWDRFADWIRDDVMEKLEFTIKGAGEADRWMNRPQ